MKGCQTIYLKGCINCEEHERVESQKYCNFIYTRILAICHAENAKAVIIETSSVPLEGNGEGSISYKAPHLGLFQETTLPCDHWFRMSSTERGYFLWQGFISANLPLHYGRWERPCSLCTILWHYKIIPHDSISWHRYHVMSYGVANFRIGARIFNFIEKQCDRSFKFLTCARMSWITQSRLTLEMLEWMVNSLRNKLMSITQISRFFKVIHLSY